MVKRATLSGGCFTTTRGRAAPPFHSHVYQLQHLVRRMIAFVADASTSHLHAAQTIPSFTAHGMRDFHNIDKKKY
jgi:hypothetical protein